ncbi:30S ribosomal protein THX [Flavihumibacter sp. R14]|nr:30S ribosomal protein THX [Flavihumibacter soli]
MGKGDIKTKRGKITKGTFGKLRKHKLKEVEKPEKSDESKTPEK